MPQLIPTELEDGSIIYFQVEETVGTPTSVTRGFPFDPNAPTIAKERAV